MANIYVRVHRAKTGDYWSEVVGDIDALVGVSVTHHEGDPYAGTDDEGETVYQNDAAIDMWEDFHVGGGPNPLKLDEDPDPTQEDESVDPERRVR
jgi:hypothetical protein